MGYEVSTFVRSEVSTLLHLFEDWNGPFRIIPAESAIENIKFTGIYVCAICGETFWYVFEGTYGPTSARTRLE